MGATELYGIPDEFSNTSQSSIGRELLAVQDSLIAKGYVIEDFMGNSTINERIETMLDLCIHCDKFIMVDRQLPGTMTGRTVLYISGNHVVKLSPSKGEYSLSEISESQIEDELLRLIDIKEDTSQDIQ